MSAHGDRFCVGKFGQPQGDDETQHSQEFVIGLAVPDQFHDLSRDHCPGKQHGSLGYLAAGGME